MKTIKVSYGGFETEQSVDECLHDAIYNKALDDFIKETKRVYFDNKTVIRCNEMIAEQLKAGGDNDNR